MMLPIHIICNNNNERRLFHKKNCNNLNGIDYLDVYPIQFMDNNGLYDCKIVLFLFFFNKSAATDINSKNIIIEGGIRPNYSNIKIDTIIYGSSIKNYNNQKGTDHKILYHNTDVEQKIKDLVDALSEDDANRLLIIVPNKRGDQSTYTLRLIQENALNAEPPFNIDPFFSSIDFSFRKHCMDNEEELDCYNTDNKFCSSKKELEPLIDYLSKDYASFRQLMLDRMSLTLQEWKAKSPADLGIVLVELLSYIGDHLSYYQDAVFTEAFLGTARRRISIDRHLRLLGQRLDRGCTARVWICFEITDLSDGLIIPKGTKLITNSMQKNNDDNITNTRNIVITQNEFENAVNSGSEPFETLHDIKAFKSHNKMYLYNWGNRNCCLPKNSISATLRNDKKNLKIKVCDVLIFEVYKKIEKPSSFTTSSVYEASHEQDYTRSLENVGRDGNLVKSHPVRITKINYTFDNLFNPPIPLVTIFWNEEDALPFSIDIPNDEDIPDLVVSKPTNKVCECENNNDDNHSDCSHHITYIPKKNNNKFFSIIRGNVVLAEHGYSIENEDIGYISQQQKRFYPRLSKGPLSFSRGAYSDNNTSSCYSLLKESSSLLTNPSIIIKEILSSTLQDTLLDKNDQNKMTEIWQSVSDLFSSNEFDRHFVVEINDELFANLLFGDGIYGMEPKKSSDKFFYKYYASYKIGNGTRGNVGKQTITSITQSSSFNPRGIIINVYNPDYAKGGIDYEDIEKARLISPEKILHTKERAVTENDYTEIVKRYPGVDHVYIKFQWTGSWYTVFIAIDRKDNKKIDENFKRGLHQYLNNFKLSCYDIQIQEPIFVPLYIKLKICLKSNILKSEVRRLLFKKLSNRDLDDDTKGFFHPDNFTFGQSLYLSRIYQHAMLITGILSVEVLTFTRFGRIVEDKENKDNGFIKIKKNEILRLDNDPKFPENGKIDFVIEGGI